MPRPIRTTESNFTFRGPVPDIADFPGRLDQENRTFYGVYQFTDEEREQIASGANIELGVHQIPMPPVSLHMSTAEVQWGDDDLLCSGCGAVWLRSREDVGDTCNWCHEALYSPAEQPPDSEPEEKPDGSPEPE